MSRVYWTNKNRQTPTEGQPVIVKRIVCRHPQLYDYERAIFRGGAFVSYWSGQPLTRVKGWCNLENEYGAA